MSLFIVNSDRELFDAWFQRKWKKPRTRAQRGNWEYRRRMAWEGWRAARVNPEPPMLENTLTRVALKGLTPDDVMRMAQETVITPRIEKYRKGLANLPTST